MKQPTPKRSEIISPYQTNTHRTIRDAYGRIGCSSAMKLSILIIALIFTQTCGSAVFASWRFIPPAAMVKSADIIAIVDVGPVKEEKTPAGVIVFHYRSEAKVERIIKGAKLSNVTLVAGITTPEGAGLCVPDYDIKPGRHLVFLRSTEGRCVALNAGLGFLPIENEKVEWFADVNAPMGKRVQKSLNAVIAEIDKLME